MRSPDEEEPAAAQEEPTLPVVLLVVETVSLVERPDGLERAPRDRDERAGEAASRRRPPARTPPSPPGRRARRASRRKTRAAAPRVGRQRPPGQLLRPRLLRRREEDRPRAVREERRARGDEPVAADGPRQSRDRSLGEEEVGVREEERLAARGGDPGVQPSGVAEVPRGEEHGVGVRLERRRSVRVARVDDDDRPPPRVPRPTRVLAERRDRARGERADCGRRRRRPRSSGATLPRAVALEFRPAGKSDRPAILELFEAAFKAAASPADFAWKYDENPQHRRLRDRDRGRPRRSGSSAPSGPATGARGSTSGGTRSSTS